MRVEVTEDASGKFNTSAMEPLKTRCEAEEPSVRPPIWHAPVATATVNDDSKQLLVLPTTLFMATTAVVLYTIRTMFGIP